MLKIDTHQHFWQFDKMRHAWIKEDMKVVQKDFLPADLAPLLNNAGINACITVQADETEAENDFMLALAKENDFIKGVIGWLDFFDPQVSERLAYYSQFDLMKGFRFILQNKQPRDLLMSDKFIRGIKALGAYDLVYEILIFSDQIPYATALVKQFPKQRFVLNHLAKPMIKAGEIKQWETAISSLAKHENVYCKVSGMVTEADWKNWNYADISPYMDVVFSLFGIDRVMFGSDWPVCNLAADYQKVMGVVETQVNSLTINEQEKFWSLNAAKCYQL